MNKDWEIIKDTARQRTYQLFFEVRYFKRPGDRIRTIEEELSLSSPIMLAENMRIIEDTRVVRKVCISDAHTHVERLVFPVFYAVDLQTNRTELFTWYLDIDGYMTSMTDGGDWSTVYPDEVYLRHLRLLNRRVAV